MMKSWNEDFRLRNYEIGPDGRTKATTIMNIFQEAASHHADELGIGFSQLIPRNLGWVLTKLRLNMYRYPGYGETISIRTWPRGRKKIFAYRDVAFNVGDELIGIGTSVWCIIDLEVRKALSLDKELHKFPAREERLFEKDIPSVPSLKEAQWRWETTTRLTELDLNSHVNNSVYLGWAVETLPYSYPEKYFPQDVTFAFKKEAPIGTRIISSASAREDRQTIHSLTNEDNAELARISIVWRDKI